MTGIRIEFGSGERPTPGYVHTDAYPRAEGVLSIPAYAVSYPPGTVNEVLALGVIEHLTYDQARATFTNVWTMLEPGGVFLFDVPDLPVWCDYLVRHACGESAPFTLEHVLSTLYGWQRDGWEGDIHKSGWTRDMLDDELVKFSTVEYGVAPFVERADRRRFFRPADAHLYVKASK